MKIRNVFSSFIATALTFSTASAHASTIHKMARPPQFILLSFDGSKSIPFWQETRSFAERNNVGFTYFISGVYFLSGHDTQLYEGPNHKRGKSDIGFGKSPEDIQIRTEQVLQARNENLEMGSHVNGHFDGSRWSFEDWQSELNQFKTFIQDVFSINRFHANYENEWSDKIVNEIKGIRAPLLGVNKDYYRALKEAGYTYDTSGINMKTNRWPRKDENGLWMLPLQAVRLAGTGKRTITMDYNVMVSQCDNKFIEKEGTVCRDSTPEKFQAYEEETYETYVNLFKENYFSNRAPIVIGHHFSLWNRGAYWKAMQRFAADVCNLEEVRCITYSEMINWLNKQTGEKQDALAQYEASQFPVMPVKELNIISKSEPTVHVDADIVHDEEKGSLVVKLQGRDARLVKFRKDLAYEWRVDGVVHSRSSEFRLPEISKMDGQTVSLSLKTKNREIVGTDKTIHSNGYQHGVWLESSRWQKRILRGDLPEAHTENIDEELLIKSRVR